MKNGFRVKFDYDLKDFEKKANQVISDVQSETEPILKKSTIVFANAAAKKTPPDIGSYRIKKERYFRPVISLKKLLAGEYGKYTASEIDRGQFSRGMRYKVINDRKRNENAAYAYTKTLADAKALSRIKTRGLSKTMWGKSLTQIGVDVPLGIQRLISQSPRLSELPYSRTSYGKEPNVQYVEITNQAKNIERFGKMAERAGEKAVARELKWRLKAIAEKERKL